MVDKKRLIKVGFGVVSLVLFLITSLIVAGLGWPIVWGIDDEKTFQIHAGMTKSEVEKILGKAHNFESGNSWSKEEIWEYYLKDFGFVSLLSPFCITFDEHGKVINTWVQ